MTSAFNKVLLVVIVDVVVVAAVVVAVAVGVVAIVAVASSHSVQTRRFSLCASVHRRASCNHTRSSCLRDIVFRTGIRNFIGFCLMFICV